MNGTGTRCGLLLSQHPNSSHFPRQISNIFIPGHGETICYSQAVKANHLLALLDLKYIGTSGPDLKGKRETLPYGVSKVILRTGV